MLRAAVLACVLVHGSTALAQACCAGAGAYQPARLKLHEDFLAGFDVKVSGQLGSADEYGSYHATPAGSGEQDFTEDFFATGRMFERGQFGLDVPMVETNRYVPGLSDFGGGVGDMALTFRWDFIYANESAHLPGIAVLGGVTFPTGTPPESSTSPLGASATGQGSWQAALGVAIERMFLNHIALNATGLVTESFVRHVDGVEEQLGTLFSGLLAAGWVFDNESAVALTLTFSDSLDASLNQQDEPNSARRVNTLGIAGGYPFNDQWRIQGSVFWDLPVLGQNHIDGLGASFTLIRAFL